MLQYNLCLMQEATAQYPLRQYNSEAQAIRAALPLYQRACRRGWIGRIWAALTGRPRRLLDLHEIKRTCTVHGRHHAGTRSVPVDHICGSEGRCDDFDRAFYPLRPHDRQRWLRVAIARQMGLGLPPVKLIQVGDVYFVRDGHHRVSVARVQGQKDIDAEVTVWDISRPWPWERAASIEGMVRQPA